MFRVSETDMKFMAPPICLAASALAIFQPSPPKLLSAHILKVTIVLKTVLIVPSTKAGRSCCVDFRILRRSEEYSKQGIDSGTSSEFISLYVGDTNGIKFILDSRIDTNIVAIGALIAFPTVVRRSATIPAALMPRTAMVMYIGFAC